MYAMQVLGIFFLMLEGESLYAPRIDPYHSPHIYSLALPEATVPLGEFCQHATAT